MKPETMIYVKVKRIIPEKSEKTVFFVGMTDTSQETFFYAFIDGKPIQCFTLAEQDELDENELTDVFSDIVNVLRESKLYTPGKYNVGTIVVDGTGIKLGVENYEMNVSEYKIKKEWKANNL